METKLTRIAEIAKEKPNEVFTSLYHHLNVEMLLQCHKELSRNKASGIDGVTKAHYEANLEENITKLVKELKNHSYKPQAVRRVYIPKGEGKEMRPLGIPAYEDKIVQLGLSRILQAIYEADFLNVSYGFRPNRSCHDAIKQLNRIIEKGKISYVVDADIKGFFNNVDHRWLIKFIGHRIADPNIKRLIVKYLKAGTMENEEWEPTELGTPQGPIISPVLANIYLHYALDLWFERIVKKSCKGQAELVRYADDFVCCFQYKEDAHKFYNSLIKRLAKFNLEVADDKTKIIMFGRFAEENCRKMGLGKPETFDFLGFTHYCSKSKQGKFRVKRKTSMKKFKAKIKEFKQWIKAVRNLHDTKDIFDKVRAKLLGHYRYYGVTDNSKMVSSFRHNVLRILFKWLNRRSQRKSFEYNKFNLYLKVNPLPNPKIYVNIYG
jgi:RNA-directed DNA polymerase